MFYIACKCQFLTFNVLYNIYIYFYDCNNIKSDVVFKYLIVVVFGVSVAVKH